jgi:ADP-ribosyl-[dinitrogen reductase] hydrolase
MACGDALGRPVEFESPETIRSRHGRVTEMLAEGTHRQPAGTITDDTELGLCIARSLVAHEGFVPAAVADRFVEWYNSDPFDVGRLTASALRRLDAGGSWETVGIEDWKHLPEGQNAGNGSVMRCAPYGVAFAADESALVTASRVSSALTHADLRCQWSCVVLNATIAGLLRDAERPLADAIDVAAQAPDAVLEAARSVEAVLSGEADPDNLELENGGYVVTTLQAGLFCGLTAETAADAIVDAVMLGGDTDTIGAVAGAVAGARFGADALPKRWLRAIDESDELEALGRALAAGSFDVDSTAESVYAEGTLDL